MKLNSIFYTSFALGVGFCNALAVSEAHSPMIASSYNTLFYYDANQITNPTFVGDVMNGTSLAYAASMRALEDDPNQDHTWQAFYDHADTTLSNIGWDSQGTPTTYDMNLCGKATPLEAIAAAYESLFGPDYETIGATLVHYSRSEMQEDVANVLASWGSLTDCSFCSDDESQQSVSILHLKEGATPTDLTMELYTFYFSSADGSVALTDVVVAEWAFNQRVYDNVRALVAEKIDVPKVQSQIVAPAQVLDSLEASVEPSTPTVFQECTGNENPKPTDEVRPNLESFGAAFGGALRPDTSSATGPARLGLSIAVGLFIAHIL